MKIGKLTNDELQQIIFRHLKSVRKEVLISPGIGEDCAVVDMGSGNLVISTDPITGTAKNIGKLAVHIACNDIASNGIEPIGLTVTLLIPPSACIDEVEMIIKDMQTEASRINVDILGGHTEVTDAVNRFVISATAIGRTEAVKNMFTKNSNPGDYIIMTKAAGIEGTSIIAYEKEEELKEILSENEMNEAKSFANHISVVPEGMLGGRLGVSAMHDVTEGGVLGAAHEMALSSGLGCEIELSKIMVEPVTEKICRNFDIDPLRLISSGSMMMTCSEELLESLKRELLNLDIKFSVIGKMTKNNDKIMLLDGVKTEIEPPSSDELYKVI